jgi:hypothetical protein
MPYLISVETFEAVKERLKSGSPAFPVVAKELGISVATVTRIAEGRHVYQTEEQLQTSGSGASRKSFRAVGEQREVFLPTPEQIEIECIRLRAARPPIADDYDDEN